MKVKELYDAVALLGFETDIDEEATFFPALNTALHDVLRLVPQKKRAFLAHYPPTALATVSDKLLYSGGVLSYQAEEARAFYIEVSGQGEIIFTKSLGNAVTPKTTWDNPYGYRVIRCFLNDIKKIEVKAETMCKVRRMALYDELTSSSIEDIPEPSEYISYDLGRVFDDFGKLHEQPKITEDGEKKTLSDYTVDGNVLSLPRDAAGDIEIVYLPAIPQYTADDKNKDVDVPDDCIGALKLLIASYVWLDDNASRAQYYKSLYNEEIALVVSKRRDLNPVKYESVNNW